MNIEVWFFGPLRTLSTRTQVVILDTGARFSDLCDRLSQSYGVVFDQEIQKKDDYFIMINGSYCNRTADVGQRILIDGDIVAFLPLIAGG